MPDPGFADDDWGDLYRELNVDKAPAPQPDAHTPDPELPVGDEDRPALAEDAPPDEEGDLLDQGGDESGDEAGEGEVGGEGQPGEDQPGTGRKRRRRRRRRKKGAAGENGELVAESESADEPVAEYGVAVRTGGDEEADANPDDVPDEEGGVALAAEEDTGGEVLRELIANWNVPSWDAIVTGLHRPDR